VSYGEVLGVKSTLYIRVTVSFITFFNIVLVVFCIIVYKDGLGSSVIIVTGYGLDGPALEFLSGCDISHTFRPVLGSTQPPVQWVPGLSRG
jgi:hypothetical protein